MFGSCLARAAWILGIAIGALGLTFAVGAWVAYLVSSSYDERFADERDPVVSVDAQPHNGSLTTPDARTVTEPQPKLEKRARGDLHALGAAVRDSGPPSRSSARSDGAGTYDERSRASGPSAKRQPSTSVSATVSASAPATVSASAPATVSAPSARSDGAGTYDERSRASGPSAKRQPSTAVSATVSASASATAKPRPTIWWSWWWRSGRR